MILPINHSSIEIPKFGEDMQRTTQKMHFFAEIIND